MNNENIIALPAKGWRKRQIMEKQEPEWKRMLPDFFYTPVAAYLLGLFMGYLLWGIKP